MMARSFVRHGGRMLVVAVKALLLRNDRAALAVARVVDLILRWTSRKRGVALVYHAVGHPPGRPLEDLVPTLDSQLFEDQLRFLTSRYDVVPATRLLEAVERRRRGERFPVAVTLDDDLRCHRDISAAILRDAGVPATFFLTGMSLGQARAFWWERLQRAVDSGLLGPAARYEALAVASTDIRRAAQTIESMDPEQRDALDAELLRMTGPPPDTAGLRVHDVISLVEAGFDIGFHTLRHDALPTLSDGALRRAMTVGRAGLEAAVGGPVRSIAFPHGSVDARVPQAVAEAGFDAGFTVSGACVRARDDPSLLARWEPPFAEVATFSLGMLGRLIR